MSFLDWASALSNIVMAIASVVAILVSYPAVRRALPPPPFPFFLPPPPPHTCPAVADVEALRLQVGELTQRLTDLEELKERLVEALQ